MSDNNKEKEKPVIIQPSIKDFVKAMTKTDTANTIKENWLPRSYAFDQDVDKRISDLAAQEKELNSRIFKTMKGLKTYSGNITVDSNIQHEKVQKTLDLQQRIIERLG